MKVFKITLSLLTVFILLGLPSTHLVQIAGAAAIGVPANPVAEGEDFATRVLRDPWDMSQFSDISQYLNESGQRDIIRNPAVNNGVFSGVSAGSMSQGNNGNFYPLFPGYETAMLIGKVGHQYPINAQQYHCLYFAMKVDTPSGVSAPDRYRVFWFADERMNKPGNEYYGWTYPVRLYEPGTEPAAGVNIWNLQKADLSNPPEGFVTETALWNDRAQWQGLRIDPTIYANTPFAVDWVRLTNCQPNYQTITWTPNSSLTTMWLKPAGTNRYIRIATDLDGNSGRYQLDVQGIAPEKYYLGLSQSLSACCIVESSETLEINQAPIVTFANPNFYSGLDYATSTGNPWDFRDAADVVKVGGAQSSFLGGVLDLVTQSSSKADPKVFLNTPQLIPNSQEYRYLSFRLYTEGPWQNTPDGMILRWIWVQLNKQGDECYRVSHDIPLDVGWHIYSIDLHHAFNGIAEEVAASCNGLSWHWLDSSPLIKFRMDPNENILGVPLHQQLDWVRLTKPERVPQGTPYTIRVGLNKPPDELSSTQFYYTSNPSSPTQHQAQGVSASLNSTSPAISQSSSKPSRTSLSQFFALLPFAVRNYVTSDLPVVENEVNFNWDTSGVNPGDYYICAQVADGVNSATYCSEVPVSVVAN